MKKLVLILLVLQSCVVTKIEKSSVHVEETFNTEEVVPSSACYTLTDTSKFIIFYLPPEEIFYLNNFKSEVDEICDRMEYGMSKNKGIKYYYEPGSQLSVLYPVLQKIEECYEIKLDELSQNRFQKKYSELQEEHKIEIDSLLSHRVISEE